VGLEVLAADAQVIVGIVLWKAPDDRPLPVTTTTSGSLEGRRMSARVCSRAAIRLEPVASRADTGTS